MNRILFEKDEIRDGFAEFGGERARHVVEILGGTPGQSLKTGEIDGLAGTSKIVSVSRGESGPTVRVKICHDTEPPAPWADMILAPPRPRVLKRLLPQLASMGAGRIILVAAEKTEKAFWGATLLKERNWRGLFAEGLVQAGTTAMPKLKIRRNLKKFLSEELDAEFPGTKRVVAHPYSGRGTIKNGGRLLLAIGPEGGWTDEEVDAFAAKGFAPYSLGPRILKTETAAIALLARLEDGGGETAQ